MRPFTQRSYPVRQAWPPGSQPGMSLRFVGLFRSRGGFVWEQVSSQHSLHVIGGGDGEFVADGKSYRGGPGTAFMFYPGMHVQYRDFPGRPWRYTWLTLQGRLVDSALGLAGVTRTAPVSRTAGNPAFNAVRERVVHDVTTGSYGPLFPIAAAWALVEALGGGSVSATESGDTLAEACAAIIENQLGSAPTVHQLAAHFGVDRSTLFRTFREHLGTSPKEFIERSRFERACRLLRTTRLSVKEIALNCGFGEQCYFSAAFRRRFGAPPSRWREELLTAP